MPNKAQKISAEKDAFPRPLFPDKQSAEVRSQSDRRKESKSEFRERKRQKNGAQYGRGKKDHACSSFFSMTSCLALHMSMSMPAISVSTLYICPFVRPQQPDKTGSSARKGSVMILKIP